MIIRELKRASLRLRKEKSPLAALSVFAISELEKIGKNTGNRETTEAEAISALKKLIEKIEENVRNITDVLPEEVSITRIQPLIDEAVFLKSFMPQMASDEDVRNFLNESFAGKETNKGEVMKALRAKFGALIDMKTAASVAEEMKLF